jgi:hypothetical protein
MIATKRAMVTAAGAMVMATNEDEDGKGKGHRDKGVGQGTCQARDSDANKEGNGKSDEGGGATKRALATEMQLQQQRGWRVPKWAMTRAAREMAMATATKRAMVTIPRFPALRCPGPVEKGQNNW